MSEMESLQGQLLVASPGLLDPNFRRAVVLITEHSDEGAAGLVLNRPSPAPVAEIVPQLEPLVENGEQVWVGGPVQPNGVLVLGEFLDPEDAAVPLFGALGFPALDDRLVQRLPVPRVGLADEEAQQLAFALELHSALPVTTPR